MLSLVTIATATATAIELACALCNYENELKDLRRSLHLHYLIEKNSF